MRAARAAPTATRATRAVAFETSSFASRARAVREDGGPLRKAGEHAEREREPRPTSISNPLRTASRLRLSARSFPIAARAGGQAGHPSERVSAFSRLSVFHPMTWTDRARLRAAGLTTAFLAVLVAVTTCLHVGGAEVEDDPRMTAPTEAPRAESDSPDL